ncbi:U32 family peptidase [Allorhizocola rhizosphaerae]|uniref:U32 family peptidase n=1 Tax=Allorhizocola rhizosphaerae TaxID=1872709 RepID=UPI000E3E0D49|nr:U32 family peptidase [Allorhizocola rhizosphaerae]
MRIDRLTTPQLFAELGLPPEDGHQLEPSPLRFPDGGQYRVEIPSVEGPRCLEAVLSEAERWDVPVARVSQGSGVGLLTDGEIDEMVRLAGAAGVELSLFARPCAGWDASAMARSSGGAFVAASARGQDQLVAVIDEIRRAADLGVRSVLVSDLGVLSVFGQLRERGALPAEMQAKVSVTLPSANPAAARVLERLGANTINLPTDLTLAQVSAIRSTVDIPLDVYVESPDNLGGFVRHYELPRLIDIASPVYAKFGLRNAPDIYPSGGHLDATAVELSRERVRRARVGLDLLCRSGSKAQVSGPGALGLALPAAG